MIEVGHTLGFPGQASRVNLDKEILYCITMHGEFHSVQAAVTLEIQNPSIHRALLLFVRALRAGLVLEQRVPLRHLAY